MSVRIRVVGDRAARTTLRRAGRYLADLGRPTREASDAVAATAARLAPKRTGRLARGVAARASGGLGFIDDRVRYAPYVEFGTRYMREQPFMRTALAATDIVTPYEQHAERAARLT